MVQLPIVSPLPIRFQHQKFMLQLLIMSLLPVKLKRLMLHGLEMRRPVQRKMSARVAIGVSGMHGSLKCTNLELGPRYHADGQYVSAEILSN